MTEAFPVTWDDPADAELAWEWDDMHFPQALAPLAGEYVTRGIAGGMNYRCERTGFPYRMRCRIIHGYAYFATRWLIPEHDIPSARERIKENRRTLSRMVRKNWEDEVLPTLLETYRWMQEAPIETGASAEIAHRWDEAWSRIPNLHYLHFMSNAGSYQSLDDLADMYESFSENPRPGEALTLVQGRATDLQRVQRDLYLLAQHARSRPAVATLICRNSHEAHGALQSVEGGADFLAALESFLTAHGHLGQPFDDLMLPSWDDDPAPVLIEIRKRLDAPEEDPEERRQRLAADADALAGAVRARLRGRPEDLHRFDAALALARDAAPLTEEHNYRLDRMLHARMHQFALRVGRRLVRSSVLADASDVFFLYVAEVKTALEHPADLQELVLRRKTERERQKTIRPPKYLGTPDRSAPPSRFDAAAPAQPDARALRGLGASSGTARGPARIVLSIDDFGRVERGDILVCPSSNPSWVPLFGLIAGLVTNTGGVTSHAAVVAREFGVPAVVGTGEATWRIRDGQVVEVDGTAGEVRLL